MDIRAIVQNIVRETVEAEIKAALADLVPAQTADKPTKRNQPVAIGRSAASTDGRVNIGPRVAYWLTKTGKRVHAADSLRNHNAKVFAYVRKHEGKTKRQIADATGIAPHSCESNINQLQQMGLIESRAI